MLDMKNHGGAGEQNVDNQQRKIKMKDLTITKIIGWVGAIILAVAAGTFTLTKYSNEQTTEALKQQIEIERQKRIEVEKKLKSPNESQNPISVIPAKELAAELKNPEILELASRLEILEKEQRSLIEKISSKSVSSLDPRSELSVLIDQLNSEDAEKEGKAIDSLFELNDPISFGPLVNYFLKSPENATQGYNPGIGSWYDFFVNLDESAGIEFVVGQLDSTYRFNSGVAYSVLNRELDSIERIDNALPSLKNLAIRSKNSPARAYSKILIERLSERKEEIISEKEEENHEPSEKPSLRDLVEEVLKEVKSLNNESSGAIEGPG